MLLCLWHRCGSFPNAISCSGTLNSAAPQVVIGSRDAVYMVMEYLEHDLKYVLELQQSKKTQPFSIGQVRE
jgi:hypothetical protein